MPETNRLNASFRLAPASTDFPSLQQTEREEQGHHSGDAAQEIGIMEFLERRIGCTGCMVKDKPAQRRSEQVPDDGDGREPRKHLAFFRSRHVRDDRHGNRAVDGRCKPVNEPDDDQRIVARAPRR